VAFKSTLTGSNTAMLYIIFQLIIVLIYSAQGAFPCCDIVEQFLLFFGQIPFQGGGRLKISTLEFF